MILRSLLIIIIILGSQVLLFSQLKGKVLDENKNPLPFTNIFIENTSTGTTSSIDGDFVLNLKQGTNRVVFKFLGYKTVVKTINYSKPQFIEVQLFPESIQLNDLVISANQEDPAYAIIRKAMAARESHLNQFEKWKCSTYIKGKIKIDSLPPLFVEMMDSTSRKLFEDQKILYLSETISDFYYFSPNEYKEIIYSSIVSGNSSGFSFNQAVGLVVNPYEKSINFNKEIVSPIAPNAFNFYKYRLEGAYYEGDHLVNKIKLIPRNLTLPAFSGYIYIIENSWNIFAVDFELDGFRFGTELLETMTLEQNYVEIEDQKWVLYNQNMYLAGNIFGFIFNGVFSGVFKDYDFTVERSDLDLKNREVVRIVDDANLKSISYWDSIRPIPLAIEEIRDYEVKDSLQTVYDSPEYKDSLQKRSNAFTLNNISMGYSHRDWRTNTVWGYDPLFKYSVFNPIQGITLGTRFYYRIQPEKYRLEFFTDVIYGFSNKKFLPFGGIDFGLKRKLPVNFQIAGGVQYVNFNPEFSTTGLESNFYNSLFSINYARFYEKRYAQFTHSKLLGPDARYSVSFEGGQRNTLENTRTSSYFKTKRDFEPNVIISDGEVISDFQTHSYFKTGLSFRLHPKNQFKNLPDRYLLFGSKWPVFTFNYQFWFTDLTSDINQLASVSIEKTNISIGAMGYSEFKLNVGKFLGNTDLLATDFFYFNGNEALFKTNLNRMDFFRALPFYTFSRDRFATLHYEHNFMGSIMSRLPLLRKTGFRTVLGLRAAHSETMEYYFEPSIGLDNIGWKFIRPLRIEYVPLTVMDGNRGEGAIIFGLTFNFNQ